MKLTTREDSTNYTCTVVKLPPKQKVEGLDKLMRVTVFGNDVLVGKDSDENELYLFFPAECRLDHDYLSLNNEFRHENLNNDMTKKGFFEDTGRVKAIKFKGIISTGYLAPVSSLDGWDDGQWKDLKEDDEFTTIDGMDLCKKYKIVHQHATTAKESRFNKKLKRFDKLVKNQFRFHLDTNQLAKNLHHFNPTDIIVITDKWHGTSAVFANVLVNKQLSLKDRIARFFGVNVIDKVYDSLYSSRSVIKNQYINKTAGPEYYNEDVWKIVHDEIKDRIEQGITLYGEIVGFLPSGKEIQKGYDYGCMAVAPDRNKTGYITATGEFIPQHKFLVYRISYTKPDGTVIEFSWQQIKDYCNKYSIEHVQELFHGKATELASDVPVVGVEHWRETFFNFLQRYYLEKNCQHCTNKVPAEGICVRIDGRDTYSTWKLKSKRFLEKESKDLDKGEVNIEDEQGAFQGDEGPTMGSSY